MAHRNTILNVLAIAGTTIAQSSNLPTVPPGVFEVSSRIQIKSTLPAAWHALTNMPAYPQWNPFVRSSLVVSSSNLTLPNQYPTEGNYLLMRVQIPPLPLPVDENTPDNPLATQLAYEKITAVQKRKGRLAWKYATDTLIQGERWQAISHVGEGMILYESREVFDGLGAPALRETLGPSLQKSFDAQGEGLKLLLEGNSHSP